MNKKSDILGINDVEMIKVDVPEWKMDDLYVRTFSSEDRDFIEHEALGTKNPTNIRAKVAVLSLCDSDGVLIFKLSDAEALGKKSAKALDRIFEAAIKFNKVSKEDVGEAEGN